MRSFNARMHVTILCLIFNDLHDNVEWSIELYSHVDLSASVVGLVKRTKVLSYSNSCLNKVVC